MLIRHILALIELSLPMRLVLPLVISALRTLVVKERQNVMRENVSLRRILEIIVKRSMIVLKATSAKYFYDPVYDTVCAWAFNVGEECGDTFG
jgi:hypothetical protein